MTQEEFYMWILNCDSNSGIDLPEFNSEFLKKYEIAKLVLEKFGIHWLSENQQRKLNHEAISAWFSVSRYIKLKYDIPEVLELLPERIRGSLSLFNSEIKSLPELRSVGRLNLQNCEIQSLPQLESVGGDLDLYFSKIKSLPKLEYVGSIIYTSFTGVDYWKNYFNETGRPHLAKRVGCV